MRQFSFTTDAPDVIEFLDSIEKSDLIGILRKEMQAREARCEKCGKVLLAGGESVQVYLEGMGGILHFAHGSCMK